MRQTWRNSLCSLLAFVLLLRFPLALGKDDVATATPLDPAALGRIGFVAGNMDPVYRFDALFEGKAQGVAGGALQGAGACLGLIGNGDTSGASILLALVCMPFGAVIGAVKGGQDAAPAAAVDEAQALAQAGVGTLQLNQAVRSSGVDHAAAIGLSIQALDATLGPTGPDDAPTYAGLAGAVDSVIEVSVTNIEAQTSGLEGVPVSFLIEARVRIVHVPDARVLDSYVLRRTSEARPVNDWLASDAVALQTELPTIARQFAVQALDETMLYRPAAPAKSWAKSKERVPGYAIDAVDPPVRAKMVGFHPFKQMSCGKDYNDGITYGWLERFPLKDLQPSFRWEALPRDFDLVLGDGPGQAQLVRYDFRLFDASGVAYERLELPDTFHSLEVPLAPCSDYRWTVRARFMMDGLPRTTEWMGAYNTIGGYADPRWIRGLPGKPALAAIPRDPTLFFPIVKTPNEDGTPCKCR